MTGSHAGQSWARGASCLGTVNFSLQSNLHNQKLSPERARRAAKIISGKKTVEDTYDVASKGGDTLTYLQSRVDNCNCHEK